MLENIIKEEIDRYLKNNTFLMEYNATNNAEIINDINSITSMLLKFNDEFIKDIKQRHAKGENVSLNEAIVKKTEHDINEILIDFKHLTQKI